MINLRRTRLKDWYEFYRETCPLCHKRGGCMINSKGDTVVCIRTESEIIFSKKFQSWIHRLNEDDKRDVPQWMKEEDNENQKAIECILDKVYRALQDFTLLSDEHYQHLTSEKRQMTDREIFARGYRSFPEKPWITTKDISFQLNRNTFEGIPGFYENPYGWSIAGRNGIMIPYRNHRNQTKTRF